MSRQKILKADSKAIHQLELMGQLKDTDDVSVHVAQSIFVLTTLVKMKETRLKLFHESVTVLKNMANYEEAWLVKLTDTQLKNLNSGAKNKTGCANMNKNKKN